MLKRIVIKGYKSLGAIDIRLSPLAVFIGPNSAGKSNFLDALNLLSRLIDVKTLKQAFDYPHRGLPLESFTYGSGGLEEARKKPSLSFTIEADVSLSDQTIKSVNRLIVDMRGQPPLESRQNAVQEAPVGYDEPKTFVHEKNLRYCITVEFIPDTGLLRMRDETLYAITDKGERKKSRSAFLEKIGNRIHVRMEGRAYSTYYDTPLDHTILSLPLYPPYYPHITALKTEISQWRFYFFEPRERMRTANPIRETNAIGPMGDELAAFLHTLKKRNDNQYKAFLKALHMILPAIDTVDPNVNNLGEIELLIREQNTVISSRLVSEGTLRILGLLAVVNEIAPAPLIGLEEPENGVHPRRLELIAELLKNRCSDGATQIIATSHSPIFADYIPTDCLYIVRKSAEGQTKIIPFVSKGSMSKKKEIDEALTPVESDLPVSQRIMRGDFDA